MNKIGRRRKRRTGLLAKAAVFSLLIFLAYHFVTNDLASGILYDLTGGELGSQSSTEQSNTRLVPPSEGVVIVTFIDVGQGDSVLIQTAQSNILIDTGSRIHNEACFFSTINEMGVTEIDLLILSHPHEDHIGNAARLIQEATVHEVKYSTGSYDFIDTRTWERTLEAIDEMSTLVTYAQPGQHRIFDDVLIEILGPIPEVMNSANNSSIFTRITHGNNVFQFSGDAYEEAELAVVRSGSLHEVDVVMLGHHGSSTSSAIDYLLALDPTYAIISVGYNNQYGHPHTSVLSLLDDMDVMVYRTDLLGTIQAISDGQYIRFVAER